MTFRNLLLFFIFIVNQAVFAQNAELAKELALLENTANATSAIEDLSKMLNTRKLGAVDKLAVQNALVHQFHEAKKWDTCLNYCQQQVAVARQEKNSLSEASFYKLIGNTYYHISDAGRALNYWKKCIAISEANHHNLLLEQCYHNVGAVILESNTNLNEAEENFQKAIRLSVANKTDTTQLGNLHYRLLATLYEVSGRLAKAGALYQTVIARARQLNDSLRIAEALMFYSKVLAKEMKFEKAIETGKEALLISQKFNKLDMEQTALDILADGYAAAGSYAEALNYQKQANMSFKERFNTDLNTKISDAEARFKNAEIQHEKEMAVINAKKEKQVYLLSAVSLFIITAILFTYFYQKRNLQQRLSLQQQVQEEKERLSRDLHDNLGSQMALLSNNIETLDTNFKKQLGISDNIDRVKDTSRQLLQTLRETIWILNKEQVPAQEFFDKLVDYAHRYLQSYPGIQLNVQEHFSCSKTLNSNEALQVFRICQEAINNACKYAQSEILMLHAQCAGEDLTIGVRDYGKGFDTGILAEGAHYGLKNMQQRAASVKADIRIESAPGIGSSVTITV
ncbi:MAG: histidine kinase [Ferruginibacter sp.]